MLDVCALTLEQGGAVCLRFLLVEPFAVQLQHNKSAPIQDDKNFGSTGGMWSPPRRNTGSGAYGNCGL
jgi:hypothetical protein